PSKWAYQKGIMEVVEVNNEHGNVMMGDLGYGHPNWEEGFVLPEAYTIEFDVYMADPRLEDRGFGSYNYWLYLYDGNYRKKVGTIYLSPGALGLHNKVDGIIPGVEKEVFYNTWNHISISVNGNSVKGYYNEYRLFNTRLAEGARPNLISLWNCCMDKTVKPVFLIDNFKIAVGAHPRYKEEVLEGKIVTHNIHFTTNSAEIIPRSYAEINRIAKAMGAHPEMSFRIEGHTDHVGTEDYNLKLSQRRATAVRQALIEMGIGEERLTAIGQGESTPIADNSTPEGKAMNRRVEFIPTSK
ncbi:MAG: OmpA family protein, partial [Bacteroidota bacterium]